MGGKHTKLRGFPPAQQPRDVPPKVIRKSLPTISRHEEKPRLPITEGRWKINDEARLSILGYKLVIPKLLGFFQMVKMDELVKRDHIPISYDRPNHHAAYDDSPRIRHKLPWSKVQVMKKLHDEWMDGKSKATQKRSLIKANLSMSKGTSLLTLPRKTSPSLIRELESVPKFTKNLYLQGTLFFKSMERKRCSRSRRMRRRRCTRRPEVAMSTPAPIMLTLEDEPLSRPSDLTLDPIFFLLKSSLMDLNQARDSCNSGYKSPNTKPRPLPTTTKSPICRYGSLDENTPNVSLRESTNAPKRANKKAMKGEMRLISEESTIKEGNTTQKGK